MSTDNDEVSQRVEVVIADIERTCQDAMSGKGTLFSLLNWAPFKRKAAKIKDQEKAT